ncbi:MAG: hypothetical protein JSV56_00135 [Methanomassiliicoccales archaeon]|nr:MAG: hypothetical protein JSV56_00135 [Methanomassiliicoccales archaeon]
MSALVKKCQKIMSFAPSKMVDNYAKRKLPRELKKYKKHTEKKLADVTFSVDGKRYDSLLDALYEKEEWDELELHFYHPNTREQWEYDTPTKLIKVTGQGRGALMLFPVNPFSLSQWNPEQEPQIEPAMFESYLAHFYSPESIKSQADKVDEKPLIPPRPLCAPYELWEDIRSKGIVPFHLVLCAYSKERRYLYHLDLLNNLLLMDFRNGKIPIANRVIRDTLDYYHLDHFLSTQELPDLAKKVLQVFFELENGDAADIEIGLGITEKMARDNINALAKRGLIDTIGKPPKARYMMNMGNIRKLGGR